MKIVIPGGTGQIGTLLAKTFSADAHDVVLLSRNPRDFSDTPNIRVVGWNARTSGDWEQEIDGADVVINLVGKNVNCRYHDRNRELIMSSRIDSTNAIGTAIVNAPNPPAVWLQASTATIYAHSLDAPHNEATGIIGGDEQNAPDTWRFSIDVARKWEQAALKFDTPHTRKVLLRSSMTMSPDRDGVFDVLLGLVRRGLGGSNGDGRQYVSWNHDEDFIRAIYWLIEHNDLSGPVNVTAPNPLPNADFMRALRQAWGTSIGLPATRWMLELGAFFMRTETELILKSRNVVPGKLLNAGFEFRFPNWQEAAHDLCKRWRERKGE